jgi:hypothetical protein
MGGSGPWSGNRATRLVAIQNTVGDKRKIDHYSATAARRWISSMFGTLRVQSACGQK